MATILPLVRGPARLPLLLIVAAVGLLALAPAAGAQDTEPVPPPVEEPAPEPVEPAGAEISLELDGVQNKNVRVNKRVVAFATVRPFVPGEQLKIGFYRKGKAIKQERKTIERKQG